MYDFFPFFLFFPFFPIQSNELLSEGGYVGLIGKNLDITCD